MRVWRWIKLEVESRVRDQCLGWLWDWCGSWVVEVSNNVRSEGEAPHSIDTSGAGMG